MKVIYYIVFFIIFTTSCSAEKEVSYLQDIDGFKYEINSEYKFTGKYVSYWEKDGKNVNKKEEIYYKNGKKNGLMTEWYENGNKKSEINIKDGKEDGLGAEWYENGNKKMETNMKDGKQVGVTTVWYENGNKKSEYHMIDFKLNGLSTMWYENGNKMVELNEKNGEKYGVATAWYDDGSKKREINFKNGEIDKYHEFPMEDVSGITGIYKCNGIGTIKSIELKPNGVFHTTEIIFEGGKHGQEKQSTGGFKLYDSKIVLKVNKNPNNSKSLFDTDSITLKINRNVLSVFGGKCVRSI